MFGFSGAPPLDLGGTPRTRGGVINRGMSRLITQGPFLSSFSSSLELLNAFIRLRRSR